jgi:hypothetical protein
MFEVKSMLEWEFNQLIFAQKLLIYDVVHLVYDPLGFYY